MVHFPGESAEYREARETLLRAEMDLREQTETVALMRRALPLGGVLKQDYLLTGMDETSVRLSDLFLPDKDDLVIYSYMFGPRMKSPCPLCTSLLDGLDGQVPHITQRVAFAVVAKSLPSRLREVKQGRGWRHLRLLSSDGTTYNADYLGEDAKGAQLPMLNVFTKRDGVVYHTYGTELLYAPHPAGMDSRHVDAICPLWSMFDYTPSGRDPTWSPKLAY